MSVTIKKQTWAEFKDVVDSKSLRMQCEESTNWYHLYAFDGSYGYSYPMVKDDGADQTDFEGNYKSGANEAIYDGLVKITDGTNTVVVSDDGEMSSDVGLSYNVDDEALVTDDPANLKLAANGLKLDDIILGIGGQITTADPVQFSAIKNIDDNTPKCMCDIASSTRVKMLDVEVPTGKKWFLTSWDASGEEKGFYELKEFDTSTGSDEQLVSFDSIAGWDYYNGTLTLDTSDKHEGTGSAKFAPSAIGSSFEKEYNPKLDMSGGDMISVWAKVDSLSCSTPRIRIKLYDSDVNYYQFALQNLGTAWQQFNFDLSEASGIDISAVKWITVGVYDSNGKEVHVDDIRFTSSGTSKVIDYFFNSASNPHQHTFPTNIQIEAGRRVLIYATNKSASTGEFEVGFNGREVDV